jgi:hypothetical protein
MALKIETKGKTVEPSIYERTFTDGSKKYYAGPQRKDKMFRQPLRDSIEEARDDLKKFNIENPKAKTIIEKQAEAVAERGGTLVDNPKLNKAVKDAKLELKNYYSKIKVIHVPSLVNKHLGTNAKPSSITKFKNEIIPEIKKIGMVQTSTLKGFKALRDYQLAPSIKKGTTPKIAEKYGLDKKVFETAIKSADVAVPGFRRKIPLKFGDEAERKRAANKKEVAAQRKFSQATMEKFYSGPKDSGIQKSHMGDKFFTEVTARNLGYAPAVINQEALKEFDGKLRSLKKKQLRLIKNKPNNWKQKLEEANVKGMRLAAESGGYKTFETIDPYTLKKSQTLRDLIELNRPMSMELQKKANKMIQGADKLSQREQLVLCSLLSRGGLPGDCKAAIQNDPVKAAQVFDEAPNTSGAMQKVKNAATGFLGFLKGPGPKTFGIGVGVGAAIGLVKAFRNDDPTSYLSNEDQQKNMLVDMATQPITTDFERPAILDYQLPALGATLAGTTALAAPSTIKASKSRALGIERKPKGFVKTGARVLGRGLGVAASPALLAPFMAGDIASQVAEGDSITDIATDPLNYTYPIFAEQTDKLTKGLNPTLRKVARLGLPKIALRGLSRAGIGGLGASLAIKGLGLFDD